VSYGKTLITWGCLSLSFLLAPLQVSKGSNVVVRMDPVYAVVVDPIADHLDNWRWPCAGDGCADSEDIGRLATSVRAHSERTGVPVKLLIGIVMVENPWLDTLAVSRSGAVGLYQVMPMHTTAWPECEDALETIEGSTCRGASIFAWFLARGNERQSLLQYNGCYQEDCEGYPAKVWEEAESYSG